MPAEPQGAALIGPTVGGPASGAADGRQERREMFLHADRTDTRAAATVRDAEGLAGWCETSAELTRFGDADER
jgi:hypothetical protein